jgi:hypothetical protein
MMTTIKSTVRLEAHTVVDVYGKVDRKFRVVVADVSDVFEIGMYDAFSITHNRGHVEMRVIKGFKRNRGEMTIMSSRSKRGRTKLIEPFFEFSQNKYFAKHFVDAIFDPVDCVVEVIDTLSLRIRFAMPDFVEDTTSKPKKVAKSKVKAAKSRFSAADEAKMLSEISILIKRGMFDGVTFKDPKHREFYLSAEALLK